MRWKRLLALFPANSCTCCTGESRFCCIPSSKSVIFAGKRFVSMKSAMTFMCGALLTMSHDGRLIANNEALEEGKEIRFPRNVAKCAKEIGDGTRPSLPWRERNRRCIREIHHAFAAVTGTGAAA